MLFSTLAKLVGLIWAGFFSAYLIQMVSFWLQLPSLTYHSYAFLAVTSIAIFWAIIAFRIVKLLKQQYTL